MLNHVVLVGRLTEDPRATNTDSGVVVTSLTMAVQRTYKNPDGIYDTDFIKCTLWNNIASNTVEYCKKGDIIGIKGRIQTSSYEAADGTKRVSTEVIAEKVSFLTTKKSKENKTPKKT